MKITLTEFHTFQLSPTGAALIAAGATEADQMAAAQVQKDALLALQADQAPPQDWAVTLAALQAERDEFLALGNVERVNAYAELIDKAQQQLIQAQ